MNTHLFTQSATHLLPQCLLFFCVSRQCHGNHVQCWTWWREWDIWIKMATSKWSQEKDKTNVFIFHDLSSKTLGYIARFHIVLEMGSFHSKEEEWLQIFMNKSWLCHTSGSVATLCSQTQDLDGLTDLVVEECHCCCSFKLFFRLESGIKWQDKSMT